MSNEPQSGLNKWENKWENIKRRGFWRFVLLRGVLGWGIPMSIFGITFEHAWKKKEQIWLIFGICLICGFAWGFWMWAGMNRLYRRRSN